MVAVEHQIFCHLHTSIQKKEGKIWESSAKLCLAQENNVGLYALFSLKLHKKTPQGQNATNRGILLSVSFCCLFDLSPSINE